MNPLAQHLPESELLGRNPAVVEASDLTETARRLATVTLIRQPDDDYRAGVEIGLMLRSGTKFAFCSPRRYTMKARRQSEHLQRVRGQLVNRARCWGNQKLGGRR